MQPEMRNFGRKRTKIYFKQQKQMAIVAPKRQTRTRPIDVQEGTEGKRK